MVKPPRKVWPVGPIADWFERESTNPEAKKAVGKLADAFEELHERADAEKTGGALGDIGRNALLNRPPPVVEKWINKGIDKVSRGISRVKKDRGKGGGGAAGLAALYEEAEAGGAPGPTLGALLRMEETANINIGPALLDHIGDKPWRNIREDVLNTWDSIKEQNRKQRENPAPTDANPLAQIERYARAAMPEYFDPDASPLHRASKLAERSAESYLGLVGPAAMKAGKELWRLTKKGAPVTGWTGSMYFDDPSKAEGAPFRASWRYASGLLDYLKGVVSKRKTAGQWMAELDAKTEYRDEYDYTGLREALIKSPETKLDKEHIERYLKNSQDKFLIGRTVQDRQLSDPHDPDTGPLFAEHTNVSQQQEPMGPLDYHKEVILTSNKAPAYDPDHYLNIPNTEKQLGSYIATIRPRSDGKHYIVHESQGDPYQQGGGWQLRPLEYENAMDELKDTWSMEVDSGVKYYLNDKVMGYSKTEQLKYMRELSEDVTKDARKSKMITGKQRVAFDPAAVSDSRWRLLSKVDDSTIGPDADPTEKWRTLGGRTFDDPWQAINYGHSNRNQYRPWAGSQKKIERWFKKNFEDSLYDAAQEDADWYELVPADRVSTWNPALEKRHGPHQLKLYKERMKKLGIPEKDLVVGNPTAGREIKYLMRKILKDSGTTESIRVADKLENLNYSSKAELEASMYDIVVNETGTDGRHMQRVFMDAMENLRSPEQVENINQLATEFDKRTYKLFKPLFHDDFMTFMDGLRDWADGATRLKLSKRTKDKIIAAGLTKGAIGSMLISEGEENGR